jgi:K+-transporting ATPase ATPase B chain
MRLHSPESAVISAVIFNALIIICLVPIALKGVAYKPMKNSTILSRNLLIFGLGGLAVPFIAIKLIDMAVSLFL